MLFTPEFLELKRYEALSSNQKIYFGPDIPHTFITPSGILKNFFWWKSRILPDIAILKDNKNTIEWFGILTSISCL
jgi:hypothetical protein